MKLKDESDQFLYNIINYCRANLMNANILMTQYKDESMKANLTIECVCVGYVDPVVPDGPGGWEGDHHQPLPTLLGQRGRPAEDTQENKHTGTKHTGTKHTGTKHTGNKHTGTKYTGTKIHLP